jgi:hypothetical protein
MNKEDSDLEKAGSSLHGEGHMTARAFIVMMAFLFSACATTQSPISHLPKVQMEGNRLGEPDYGYSLELPTGFTLVDETFLTKLDPAKPKQFLSELSGFLSLRLRAIFFNSSNSSLLMLTSARSIYATKQHAVNAGRRLWESWAAALNSQSGKQELFNIQIDKYERLTDLNASADTDYGYRAVAYYCPYNFRESLYEIWLLFMSPISNFEYYLLTFYPCVKSIKLTDQTPRSEGQEQKEPASVRLEKLKKLKESGLISEQDYERKKREILNRL